MNRSPPPVHASKEDYNRWLYEWWCAVLFDRQRRPAERIENPMQPGFLFRRQAE